MEVNIPGKISSRLTSDTLAELEKYEAQVAKLSQKYLNSTLVEQGYLGWDGLQQMGTGNNWDWTTPNVPPFSPYIQPSTSKPTSPFPNPFKKQTPINTQKPNTYQDELKRYMKVVKDDTFERLMDEIFTLPEKEQFLIDTGYELEWDNQDGSHNIYKTLADGTRKRITNSLNDLFMKEILIKFKITLLTKSTLKMKI